MTEPVELTDDTEAAMVTNLVCVGLGENYTSVDETTRLVTSTDAAVFTVYEHGTLVGASTVYILSDRGVDEITSRAGTHCVTSGERIAVAKASTVTHSARGAGIGSALATARLE